MGTEWGDSDEQVRADAASKVDRRAGRGRAARRLGCLAALTALLAAAALWRSLSGGGHDAPDFATVSAVASKAVPLRLNHATPGSSLILIVSDTLRRDRLGIHGGPAVTPAFDSFARNHFLFERAYTQSPWTKPSMATAFTSLYPSQHKVLDPPARSESSPGRGETAAPLEVTVLDEELTTLAERLKSAGFRTAAFVGNPWMLESFGFGQGFDHYDDSFAAWNVTGDVVSRAGLNWLESIQEGERFFLYLHYMDCHRPYVRLDGSLLETEPALRTDRRPLPPMAADEILDQVRFEDGSTARNWGVAPSIALVEAAYDAGVGQFDRALGALLDGFSSHPAFARTAIVVTSDHGEALFERGYGNHGNGLYDDELAIPFAARLPGVQAESFRIADPIIGLVDLMPSMCAYLGLDCPAEAAGESWIAERNQTQEKARVMVMEGVLYRPQHRAVRVGDYKLLWQPQGGPEGKSIALFDLASDPGETQDLLQGRVLSDAYQEFITRVLEAGDDAVPAYASSSRQTTPLRPDVERRLRSLGYIK